MQEDKTVAQNRKARHDYTILSSMEVGLVLFGTEIKSLRAGQVNLKDGYASIEKGELWLWNVHISPYEAGTIYNRDPLRPRKLLAHKLEILRLQQKIKEKGLTLVPLKIYIKNGKKAKLELGVARGKQLQDKRDAMAERDSKRDIARAMKQSKSREF